MKAVIQVLIAILIGAIVGTIVGLIGATICTGIGTIVSNSISPEPTKMDKFFNAIAFVESNNNNEAVGDHGKSLGRYQIQEVYWKDAVESNKNLRFGYTWQDVRDPEYARKVMESYFKRYAKKAFEEQDFETLSRIHNGGPKGATKKATIKYWEKVKEKMND